MECTQNVQGGYVVLALVLAFVCECLSLPRHLLMLCLLARRGAVPPRLADRVGRNQSGAARFISVLASSPAVQLLFFLQSCLIMLAPLDKSLEWLGFVNLQPQESAGPECIANLDAYQKCALALHAYCDSHMFARAQVRAEWPRAAGVLRRVLHLVPVAPPLSPLLEAWHCVPAESVLAKRCELQSSTPFIVELVGCRHGSRDLLVHQLWQCVAAVPAV